MFFIKVLLESVSVNQLKIVLWNWNRAYVICMYAKLKLDVSKGTVSLNLFVFNY